MDDLISRQAAIDALYHVDEYNGRSVEAIRKLPPAEPKTGKWIHASEEMWKCDQCGEISCCSPNFCPDCGAKMEGASE